MPAPDLVSEPLAMGTPIVRSVDDVPLPTVKTRFAPFKSMRPEVPAPNPLAMTAYLCALLLAGCVIFAIAIADLRASRRLLEEEQIELLAAELRKATAERIN